MTRIRFSMDLCPWTRQCYPWARFRVVGGLGLRLYID